MAIWPITGVVVVDEVSLYPTRRVLHLRCDQGDVAVKIDLQARSAATIEQGLAALGHVASRGFRHAPALLRTSAGAQASWTPSRTMTLLEYIPAPVMAGHGDRIAGWGDLGVAAARLNSIADYDVPFGVPVDRAAAELAARGGRYAVRRRRPLAARSSRERDGPR